jgi:hypothetical protein
MLLAPKTLWAMVNLNGSVGGKYGAKTHFSPHRRRRILQAAQGLSTTGGGEDCWEGEGKVVGEDCWEGEGKVVGEDCWESEGKIDGELEKGEGTVIGVSGGGDDAVLPLYSIFSERDISERERERELWVRKQEEEKLCFYIYQNSEEYI